MAGLKRISPASRGHYLKLSIAQTRPEQTLWTVSPISAFQHYYPRNIQTQGDGLLFVRKVLEVWKRKKEKQKRAQRNKSMVIFGQEHTFGLDSAEQWTLAGEGLKWIFLKKKKTSLFYSYQEKRGPIFAYTRNFHR